MSSEKEIRSLLDDDCDYNFLNWDWDFHVVEEQEVIRKEQGKRNKQVLSFDLCSVHFFFRYSRRRSLRQMPQMKMNLDQLLDSMTRTRVKKSTKKKQM